jgi:hypothetical protein
MDSLDDSGPGRRGAPPALIEHLARQAADMEAIAARWLAAGDVDGAAQMHLVAARLACCAEKARGRGGAA